MGPESRESWDQELGMGQDSKHQKVRRVGARELEELGTEDGMGDLGSGVGTEGARRR